MIFLSFSLCFSVLLRRFRSTSLQRRSQTTAQVESLPHSYSRYLPRYLKEVISAGSNLNPLLFSITGSYFFLTMYDAKNTMRGVITRAIVAGLLFGLSVIAWGGGDEYDLVFAFIFLVVPFVKSIDIKRTVYGGSIIAGLTLLIAAAMSRVNPAMIEPP